jgi:ABC-type branched-subunit amino acid transport system substrate-binding protein
VQAFAAVAEQANSVKADVLSKALHSMKVDRVIGTLQWDKKDDVPDRKYVFPVWKNGSQLR